ncbi:helix-turn-helix transcriptional regulator [Haloechinothrix salitolerans]|uniref:Helix-turn-helix domain-containing protein n=1 Tax=Haloechinothrix salitolerans TaxID=926830 RepID=A0ABW2C7Y2_9PSEU
MVRPDDLSAELVRLREQAGLSGRAAAAKAGLSQSRLSRIERGEFMPDIDEVRQLCRLYRAPAEVRRTLTRIAEGIREERAAARVVLQRGSWRMQQRIGRIEQASAHVRSFQPAFVVGLLQTPEYMRGAPGTHEPDETLRARIARQEILSTDRSFTFVMTEGALCLNVGGPDVMIPQLERLADMATGGRHRLGVIPKSVAVPTPELPMHAFHLYDSRAVIVGTLTATAIITDSRDVADYEQAFAQWEHTAVFGEKARDVIDRIAGDYRSLG